MHTYGLLFILVISHDCDIVYTLWVPPHLLYTYRVDIQP